MMDIVIGVTPDPSSDDAVALGLAAARALDGVPVLTHVYPRPYDYPSQAAVDAEWLAFLQEHARETAGAALAEVIAAGWESAQTVVHGHRSSGTGLAEVAAARDAGAVVIGSAPGGRAGQLVTGSTADQLFHGSPVPVLMAPHGYASVAPERIGRLVIAHQLTRESDAAREEGLRIAVETGLEVHLVSVLTRVTRIAASTVGRDPEAMVVSAMRERAQAVLLDAVGRAPGATWQVAEGDSVAAALAAVAWRPDDVLVIGSSGAGPLRRVFLGDMSFKLLRAASVPAMVVPRTF